MTRFLLPLAIAGAFFATPAFAEEFDGPYAGAQAGVALLHVEGSILTGAVDEISTTGYGAAVLGYRLNAGGVVLGVEGDAGIHVDGGDARYGVSAIAGLPIGSASLVYGRLGYVWHEGLPADVGKGLTFGGGVETRLTGPVHVRLDYKYLDLGKTGFPDNSLSYTGHEETAGFVVGF